MASDNLVINSMYYASPYSTLPPGVTRAGVTVQANTSQIPSGMTNPILVIRLRLTTGTEIVGVSPTSGSGISSTTAVYQPDFPLSATEPYMVDVMWVEEDTPPENIDWNSALTSAPITASDAQVESASYDGTNLTVNLLYGASGIGVGAQVNVYALSDTTFVGIGNVQTEGTEVEFSFTNPGYPEAYYVGVQSAIPANNLGGAGNFSEPFSLGPVSAINEYCGIPQAAKTVGLADYDGDNLILNWTLDTVVGCIDPNKSIVEVLVGSLVVVSFECGPLSANIPIDVLEQSGVTVQIRTCFNNFRSMPIALDLVTEVPVITDVVGSKANGTVTAKVATVSTGPAIEAYLMDGDIQLAGPESLTAGEVSFNYSTADYDVEAMVGVNVVARATSANGIALGQWRHQPFY